MKKFMAFTLTLAIVAGGGWWYFFMRGGPTPAPTSVAAALSGEQTAGLVGAERLDVLVGKVDGVLGQLPTELLAEMPALVDPSRRAKALGFDPSTPAGWQSIGLNAKLGLAVAFDARVHAKKRALPILLARVDDETKLLDWVGKRLGKPLALSGPKTGVRQTELMGRTALVGTRGGLTALVIGRGDNAGLAKAGFEAFLADSESPRLDKDPEYTQLLTGISAPEGLGFINGEGMNALTFARGATEAQTRDASKYAALFPGAGFAVSRETARVRVFAAPKGLKLLRSLLQPGSKSPKFSKHLHGNNWAALRLSVNLQQGFSALGDLLPPSTGLKQKMGLLKVAMPFAVGFGWDDIANALSGHLLVAGDLGALKTPGTRPGWLLMVGVKDTAALDTLLPRALGLVKKISSRATVEPVTLGGQAGHQVHVRGHDIFVVRVENVLIAGPSQAIVEEAARPSAQARSDAAVIDGDDVAGLSIDISAALSAGQKLPGFSRTLNSAVGRKVAASPRLTARLTLDNKGLSGVLGEGQLEAMPLWAVMGLSAVFDLRRGAAAAMEKAASTLRGAKALERKLEDGAARLKAAQPPEDTNAPKATEDAARIKATPSGETAP